MMKLAVQSPTPNDFHTCLDGADRSFTKHLRNLLSCRHMIMHLTSRCSEISKNFFNICALGPDTRVYSQSSFMGRACMSAFIYKNSLVNQGNCASPRMTFMMQCRRWEIQATFWKHDVQLFRNTCRQIDRASPCATSLS